MDKSSLRKALQTGLLIFIIFIPTGILAQGYESDWGSALEVELSKKLVRRVNMSLSQEFRFNDQASNLYRSATQLSVDYSFLRKICKIGLFATYLRKEDQPNVFGNQYRFGADLSASADMGRFNYSWRTRLLSTYRDESTGSYKINPKLSYRNRFQAEYSFFNLPLKPYVAFEPFIYLNAQGGAFIDNLRYRIGTDYRVNKRSSWDLGMRIDQELQVANPELFFSLDIGYKYKF